MESFQSPDPKRFTLYLAADGKAQVTFDCNRGGGSYRIAQGTLSSVRWTSTRMACPVENAPLDQRFSRQLQGVAGFLYRTACCIFEVPMDGGTMRFSELKP